MRKYAIITNNVVSSIIEKDPDDVSLSSIFNSNSTVVDITDLTPLPTIGWVLRGNALEFPQGESDREAFEEKLADLKTDFGIKLARMAINKMGARNKILNKTGAQVGSLLNNLIPIKMLLETGALGTARYSCSQLKLVYTEYSDIFDKIISDINDFERTYTL
jgi:hypothetical protein